MFLHQRQMLTAEQLVQYRARIEKILPSIGSKEFNPTGSWLESKQIQSALDERKDLLQEERVEKICMLAEAVWDEELELARVTRKVGKHFDTFGHEVNRVLFLYPEEALFLFENNHLELLYGDVAMSIQQGYTTLLSPSTDCTLDEYRVYSQLLRQGYRMLRHSTQRKVTRYERMIGLHHYILPPKEKRTRTDDTQNNVSEKSDEDGETGVVIEEASVVSELKPEHEVNPTIKDVAREVGGNMVVKHEDSDVPVVKSEDVSSIHNHEVESVDGPNPTVKSENSEIGDTPKVKAESREDNNDPIVKTETERNELNIKPEIEVMDVDEDSDNPDLERKEQSLEKHERQMETDIEEISLSGSEEMTSGNVYKSQSRSVECIEVNDCKTESEVEVLDIDCGTDDASIISSSIQNTSSKRSNSLTDVDASDKNDICVTSTNNETQTLMKRKRARLRVGHEICDSSVIDGSLENHKSNFVSSGSNSNEKQSIQEITIDSTSPEILKDHSAAKSSIVPKDTSSSSVSEDKPLSASVCRIKWYVKREPKPSKVSDIFILPHDRTENVASKDNASANLGQSSKCHNAISDGSENTGMMQDDGMNNENSSQKINSCKNTSNFKNKNIKNTDIEVLDLSDDENSGTKEIAAQKDQSADGFDVILKRANFEIENLERVVQSIKSSDVKDEKVDLKENDSAIEVFNVDENKKSEKTDLKSVQVLEDNDNNFPGKVDNNTPKIFDVIDDENSSLKENEKQDQCIKVFDISDDEDAAPVREEDNISEIYDVTDDEDVADVKEDVEEPELIDLSDDESSSFKRSPKEEAEVFYISDDSVNKSDIEHGNQTSEIMDVIDDEDTKPVDNLDNEYDEVGASCDDNEEDHCKDERYSPAPLNKGKDYYPSPSIYVPSKNSELQSKSRIGEDFISFKSENTYMESTPPVNNLKRKYREDDEDECRNWDKRHHSSDNQAVYLSDDENMANVDQSNIKSEIKGGRYPTENNNMKEEEPQDSEKIEEELSKFYEEIEEIDLEEGRKEVNEDRWTILDSFPNAYGQLVVNMAVPPARLLPKNVCPSKSHYLIIVSQRNSPPAGHYRNHHSPNYRNNWRGRPRNHRNNSYDRSRNRPHRNFEHRGMNDSEYPRRFGHEANSDYQRQFDHSGTNDGNPEHHTYESQGMNDVFPEHRKHLEHRVNETSPDLQGRQSLETNEAKVNHGRLHELQEMSRTDTDHRRLFESPSSNHRHSHEHQGINQTNSEYQRDPEHRQMNQISPQHRPLEHHGMNQSSPELRRHINSEHRRDLQPQRTNQFPSGHRRSYGRRGNSSVYRRPRGFRGRSHTRPRRQLARHGMNQSATEHRGMNQANPNHRRPGDHSSPGHRRDDFATNSEHWPRNVSSPWSNAEVSIDYHHQTPALHAAQVAYNLFAQQFVPQLLFPTMLPPNQRMWLTPPMLQTWPLVRTPQALLPSVAPWDGGQNYGQNRDSFMDTDERQLPFQEFPRSQECVREISNQRGAQPQNPSIKSKFKQPRYFAPPRKLQRLMESIISDTSDNLVSEDRNVTVPSPDTPSSTSESSDDEDMESLVKSDDCTSVGNILRKLQIIKSTNFENINTLSESSAVVVKYDLYLPDTVFRKANPSLPDFRLIILGFQEAFPSPGKMAALQREYQDGVPFLLAIVLPDAITFFHYSVVTLPVHDASSLNG